MTNYTLSAHSERTMNTRRLSRLIRLLGLGLLLAVPAAWAQATSFSSFTVNVSGILAGGSEAVTCAGPVKVTSMVVKDPSMPPNSIVNINARYLVCTGVTTGARYLNSGEANLTRIMAATDQVQTTFAVYPDAPGGFMHARSAVATLTMNYNTVAGALTSVTGTLASQ
jgi:hypothetical protein